MSVGCTRIENKSSLLTAAHGGKLVRWLAVVAGAASLAACAQSSVVSERSGHRAVRQASVESERTTSSSSMMKRRVAAVRQTAPRKDQDRAVTASHGVASYYTTGTKTASGEKFNTLEMTAAHPTLPFGTKLRVTNVASGKSVTVRVNDRGPFVHGRVVDVSYSAADALGMVGKGVANVKLDVVD
jgi:rare lipoprotein A